MLIRKVVYLVKTLFLSQGLPETLQYLAKSHFSIFLGKSSLKCLLVYRAHVEIRPA